MKFEKKESDRETNLFRERKREKERKGWRREKKEDLVNTKNPDWKFLNNKN